MITPKELEEAFLEFSQNLLKYLPDGVISIDIDSLELLGISTSETSEPNAAQEDFMHYFHVIETADKVTLFNEKFAVWIVPSTTEDLSTTLTLIAILQNQKPHPEIAFSTSGTYNTPKYILKLLEHFLTDVSDTEATLSAINRTK